VAETTGLPPVVDEESRVLILGTLPGAESLRRQQYYSDRRNQFWALLGRVFEEPIGPGYPDRLALLREHGIAVWDVLRSAVRTGSSDAAITHAEPNDFEGLFRAFPGLRRVGFNGTKAERLWRRHIAPSRVIADADVAVRGLPSSSGTPGRNVFPFDEKLARWRAFLRP